MKISKPLLTLCLSLFPLFVLGVDKVWVGGTTSWNTAANWSPSGVPASTDDVFIRTHTNYPEVSTTVTVRNLTVNEWYGNGSKITINSGANMTVTGTFNVFGNANFIQNGGSFNHSGTNYSVSGGATITINSGTFSTSAAPFNPEGTFVAGTANLRFNGGYKVQSGKSFTSINSNIRINGNLEVSSSNANFYAGKDSLIINGRFILGNSNFYGDTAVIIINGNGTNPIGGNFYTRNANITFNPTSYTEIGSSGRFYVNSGTVLFADSARVGSNGELHAGSGTVTFTKSLLVSSSGLISNTTGTINFEGNATFASSGTLNAGAGQVNFGGNVTIDNSNGTINAGTAQIEIGGNFTNAGNFNQDSSTVIFNGSGSQTISNNVTFFNLIIETTGNLVAGGNVTVLNDGIIGSDANISIPNNSNQFNVQGDLVDSSGSLAVATNKPFVTEAYVLNSTQVVVQFNEKITTASAQTTGNYTWSGRTISSAVLIDTNKVRLTFTPAITRGVEYTLSLSNIVNARTPPGTITAGHIKRFTWTSQPATAASGVTFSNITTNAMTIKWTRGAGARRLILMRAGSAVSFIPLDTVNYIPNTSFGSGINLGSAQYCIYSGTGADSVRVTNLSGATTYHIAIYEYNGSAPNAAFQSVAATTGSASTVSSGPTVAASNILVTYVGPDSISLSWTNGNGSKRIVVARFGSAVNVNPVLNTTYTANAAFGFGTSLGSGNYVVYNGTGNNVTITGLAQNSLYHFAVIEYSGTTGAEAYLTTGAPVKNQFTYMRLNIKVMLEGAYDTLNTMRASLNSVLPLNQVYNDTFWDYTGNESVAAIPNANVVDWVLVEVRKSSTAAGATSGTLVGKRAAFILKNGSIVDLDGSSPLRMPTTDYGRMFVVIYHRNHLPMISADSLGFSAGTWNFDFTTSGNRAYGTGALVSMSNGAYAMYGGRIDYGSPFLIDVNDANAVWQGRNSINVYSYSDVNMDGNIDASDRSMIWNNQNTSRQVPD